MKSGKPRFTRRTLAAFLAGGAAASAQPAPAPVPAEELPAARQRLEQNLAALRRVPLDPKVEPAFSFKA